MRFVPIKLDASNRRVDGAKNEGYMLGSRKESGDNLQWLRASVGAWYLAAVGAGKVAT